MSDKVIGPKDLSDEEFREYAIPATGEVYRISDPKQFYMREGGSTHRIVDKAGIVHCVAYPTNNGNMVVLRWKPRDPSKPVAF